MSNFTVKAVFEYSSPHEDDLNFPIGQIITVTEEEDDDWYVGEYFDENRELRKGMFPKNFVEKYEPQLPPRPNRASRYKPMEQPQVQAVPPTPELPQQEAAPLQEKEPEPPKPQPAPIEIPAAAKSQLSPTSPAPALNAKSPDVSQELPPAPKPAPVQPAAVQSSPAPAAKKPPPPIAAKSNAFRDRIAAFNQPAAAPVAPFKPGGGPPSTFIKKPFVAPPPSRNAYVPPPREAPQVKVYRRDEDPEIAERQAQDQENAERAGVSGGNAAASTETDEDQPKPTSLKERIALLQKQQQEQAQRAAATHKEKQKKPPIRKTHSHEDRAQEGEAPALELVTSNESRERGSTDHSRPPRSAGGLRSPDIQINDRELLSDANDADQSGAGDTEDAEGTSTSVEEDDEKQQASRAPAAPLKEPDVGDQEGAANEEEEEEEEDEMDAEARRKLELRERMAKMSGGMGMAGMFGPPGGLPMGGMPPKKKKPVEKKSTGESEEYAAPPQRVPMFPGMPPVRSPEVEDTQLAVEKDDITTSSLTYGRSPEEVPDVEDLTPRPVQRTLTGERPPHISTEKRPVPPPVPTADRPLPPPIPSASRPAPPPVPLRSPSPGSESGDEMTDSQSFNVASPRTPSAAQPSKRSSYLGSDELSLETPDKRLPPPIPVMSPPASPAVARPPPPPPPTAAPPSRQPTTEDFSRKPMKGDRLEGESEYEGDYDTDIAPGATHKDALKAHARDSSLDESTTADETPVHSPTVPSGIPPLPPTVPRAVPPPPPPQPPNRVSADTPRGAPPRPPVPPPTRDVDEDDEDYDPYRYSSSNQAAPPPAPRAAPPPPQGQPPPPQNRPPPPAAPPLPPSIPQTAQYNVESSDDDDLYSSPPPRKSHDRPPPPPPQAPPQPLPHRPPPLPQERAAPPPPPPEPTQPTRAPVGRKSLDVNRVVQQGRVSMEQQRPSVSLEYMASEIDLGASSHWWTQSNMPPPSLNGRKDVLIQMDESRSGNSVEKVVVVLYMDYSQTVVTAQFEANNVSNVNLEQRQDPPPARLRQDQLEAAHDQFGARIAKDVESKQLSVVGDGTPHGLITELLKPYPNALRPVSTRSFGALVYANLANASIQQFDEIRPGDIITFRNAKFQGKHGAMHAKYSVDVGKPDHVGVVVEWDGSKKKIRAWEQGRESKKVKPESFRMGDLRSGEVRVWRVMARSWVGWD